VSTSPKRAGAPRRAAAALAVALAGCLAAALAPTASASPPHHGPDKPRAVHVSGRFIPIDDKGTYRVTGTLKGTWYTLTADTYYQSKSMIIQEGLERFEGCIDVDRDGRCDRDGAFGTDYIYWATFNPRTDRLIKGECIHPVIAGLDGFSGTRGFLNVTDRPVGANGVVSAYQGELVLNAVVEDQTVPSRPSAGARSTASSAATC
jgi:hypothetical protein